jgi:hypothetical protein
MNQVLDDSLNAGREAARKHAWRDAYELLQKADADGLLGAEDLEHLGEAAWWTGRLEQAIDFRERAYATHVEAGEPRRAALLARSRLEVSCRERSLLLSRCFAELRG